jgi:hypothetical protein
MTLDERPDTIGDPGARKVSLSPTTAAMRSEVTKTMRKAKSNTTTEIGL